MGSIGFIFGKEESEDIWKNSKESERSQKNLKEFKRIQKNPKEFKDYKKVQRTHGPRIFSIK